MTAAIVQAVIAIILPLAKMLFEHIAKKKLSDQEFITYISAHQKRRGLAGQAATDWETALKQAQAEMDQPKQTV